jgi:Domain of unknown function (DUF4115)
MDFTVALIVVGVGVVAILAREGYQRAHARPTARYLEALRRVHDTAHGEMEPPLLGDPAPSPVPDARSALGGRVPAPGPEAPPVPAAHDAGPGRETPPPALVTPPARPWAEVMRTPVSRGSPRLFTRGRLILVGVVVVALVAVSGLGYALAHHGASAPPPRATPATTAPAAQRSSPTTTVAPAPPAPVVVAGAQSSGSAAYTVSSGPVQLALAASSRCWVELRAVSAIGPVVFEGILGPGASRAFENAVGLWIRLGYPPGVVLAVDGRPLGLPASASPLDVTVNSAAA